MKQKSSLEKLLRRIAPQAIIVLILTTLMLVGAAIFQSIDPVLGEQSFYEVVFFEFITISTIGYGNQYPQTHASRVFSIFFSILGIPLLVVTLGNFGKYLTKFYWKTHGWIFSERTESELVNDKDMPGIVIACLYLLTFAIGFFFIPHSGAAYSIDDCYFSFISFATVGFGDKVPQIDTFEKFCKVITYLVWGTILNIMLISYVTNWFTQLFARQPFRGTDVEVMIGGQCITVSEITSLVAKEFHASPHQVRSILHDINGIMEDMKTEEDSEKSDILVAQDL
ncbi:Potassium channel domain-containing protein [Caenorhabditis elegans]|uniref:Potassium channel domain-containing protein n=1 Tax=Caenorhabditis elegans TaxID=6239 RepID=Q5FC72_CAEEL|nr:Potassium channel domain-containing protein [Caenorhabditis elegans]CAI46547.1 Potassium channel domain-containing protein [Caenorhabditis elegans]|eukprot:NP_001021896.1 TWiK family of potassium channels [Caenorhabditis elegans]